MPTSKLGGKTAAWMTRTITAVSLPCNSGVFYQRKSRHSGTLGQKVNICLALLGYSDVIAFVPQVCTLPNVHTYLGLESGMKEKKSAVAEIEPLTFRMRSSCLAAYAFRTPSMTLVA